MVTVITLDYKKREVPVRNIERVYEDPNAKPYLNAIKDIAEHTGTRIVGMAYTGVRAGNPRLHSVQLNSDSDEKTNAFLREALGKKIGLESIADTIDLRYRP